MFLVYPDNLSPEACSLLIDIYESQSELIEQWRGTEVLNLTRVKGESLFLEFKALRYLNNCAVSLDGVDCYIETAHIVKWPDGSYKDSHLIESREHSTMASITYLNDDYKGGEVRLVDEDVSIMPEIGKTLFFNGKKYRHGVREVRDGARYCLSIWFTSDVNKAVL